MEILSSSYNLGLYIFTTVVLLGLLYITLKFYTKVQKIAFSIAIMFTLILTTYITFIYHGKNYHEVQFEDYNVLYEQDQYYIISIDTVHKTAIVQDK